MRFFVISAMVPETGLHDVMSQLEAIQSFQINAKPVPIEASAMVLQMAGMSAAEIPTRKAPKAIAAPAPKVFGKHQAPREIKRNDPQTLYRMRQAAINFLAARAGQEFHRVELLNTIKSVADGAPFNPDARLHELVRKGLISRLGNGRYSIPTA